MKQVGKDQLYYKIISSNYIVKLNLQIPSSNFIQKLVVQCLQQKVLLDQSPNMSQNTRDSDLSIYKVIIVGQSGVGKSNLISRYVYDKFQPANNVTIGVEFISKTIQIDKNQVNLQIWDTAGQERFRSVNKVFYKNALGALVVFSLASKETFQKVFRWLKQIREQIDQNSILILVGNKCDLKQREVTVAQASKLARQQNMAYIQTSAALNMNIQKCFQMLTEAIMISYEGKNIKKKKESILLTHTLSVKQTKQKNKKKKCCE